MTEGNPLAGAKRSLTIVETAQHCMQDSKQANTMTSRSPKAQG